MEHQNQSLPPAQQIVIVSKQKSVGVALLLAFFFGPLGLLYASVIGGVIMLILSVVIGLLTLGFGLIFTWIACIIWAGVAVNQTNKKTI